MVWHPASRADTATGERWSERLGSGGAARATGAVQGTTHVEVPVLERRDGQAEHALPQTGDVDPSREAHLGVPALALAVGAPDALAVDDDRLGELAPHDRTGNLHPELAGVLEPATTVALEDGVVGVAALGLDGTERDGRTGRKLDRDDGGIAEVGHDGYLFQGLKVGLWTWLR